MCSFVAACNVNVHSCAAVTGLGAVIVTVFAERETVPVRRPSVGVFVKE